MAVKPFKESLPTTNAEKVDFWIELPWVSSFLFVVLSITLFDLLYMRELSGWGDNHVHYVSYHLFFRSIMAGELPLWSPSMLGGTPLWSSVELHNMFDPVLWLVYPVSYYLKSSSFHTFQVFIFVWLVLWGLGIYMLARVLGTGRQGSSLAAMVSACSFIAVSSYVQGNGLFLHARFFPFIMLVFVLYFRKPSKTLGFTLGGLLGLWMGSYHVGLCILVLLAFSFLLIIFDQIPRVNRAHLKYSWTIVLAGTPFAVALLALVIESSKNLYPMARVAAATGNSGMWDLGLLGPLWIVPPSPSMLETYFSQVPIPGKEIIYHLVFEVFLYPGSSFYLILASGLCFFLIQKQVAISPIYRTRILCSLGVCIVVLALYVGGGKQIADLTGSGGVWLGYRNWRFIYPYCLLSLGLLGGFIFSFFVSSLSGKRGGVFHTLIALLGILAILSMFAHLLPMKYYVHFIHQSELSNIKLYAHFLVPAVLFLLARRFFRREWLGWSLLLIVCIDLMVFNRLWINKVLPKLTNLVAQREPMLSQSTDDFKLKRFADFPIQEFAPFHKEGPAVWGYPSMRMDPESLSSASYYENMRFIKMPYPGASHWFRSVYYQRLMKSELSEKMYRDWFGVTGEMARFYSCFESVPSSGMKSLNWRPDRAYLFVRGLHRGIQSSANSFQNCAEGSRQPVEIKEIHSGKFKLSVDLHQPGLVYLADGYHPDWRATVDGELTPILLTNGNFKSVFVSEGKHEIEFVYRPWLYLLSFWGRVSILFSWVLIVFVAGWKAVREPNHRRIWSRKLQPLSSPV